MIAAHHATVGIIAIGLAGCVVLLGSVAFAAYLIHVGMLDAAALAEKTSVPRPKSAVDWPEMRLCSVLAEPEDRNYVLVSVVWPARPRETAVLLFEVSDRKREFRTLEHWSSTDASVIPLRRADDVVELRRRRSLQRVHAHVLAEK
jgi:hypothetical protein